MGKWELLGGAGGSVGAKSLRKHQDQGLWVKQPSRMLLKAKQWDQTSPGEEGGEEIS